MNRRIRANQPTYQASQKIVSGSVVWAMMHRPPEVPLGLTLRRERTEDSPPALIVGPRMLKEHPETEAYDQGNAQQDSRHAPRQPPPRCLLHDVTHVEGFVAVPLLSHSPPPTWPWSEPHAAPGMPA